VVSVSTTTIWTGARGMVTSLPRRLDGVAGGQGGPSASREAEPWAAVTFAAAAAFRYDCRRTEARKRERQTVP
jgi:hypothetical protein